MSNQTTADSREFYCFISYKHRDGDQFIKDEEWAEALALNLTQLHIPSKTKPPINDQAFINLNPKDDFVYPIFRDYEVLNAGSEFSERIIAALGHSRRLVVIITDEMLKDQEGKVKRKLPLQDEKRYEDAWCFREIFHFLKQHSPKDIILVYIGTQSIEDVIPSVLTKGLRKRDIDGGKASPKQKAEYYESLDIWKGKNIVLINPAEGEKTKKAKKESQRIIAAKIAANIFGTDTDRFRNYQMEEEAKRKAIMGIWILVTVILILLLGFGFSLKRMSDARNYLYEAHKSLDSGNRLAAGKLAQKAYHSWSWMRGVAEVMWDAGDSTFAVLGVKSSIAFDQKDSLFAYVDKNRYVVIADTRTFQEIERIDARKAYKALFSPDASKLIVLQDKEFFHSTGRVYDLNKKEWDESPFYNGNGGVDPLFSQESSYFWTEDGVKAIGGRACYIHDDNDYQLRPSKASFIGTDSIFVALFNKEGTIKSLLYNFADTDQHSGSSNVYGPSDVFYFPEGTKDAVISPDANQIVSYTENSISTWIIEYSNRCYSIREEHRENTEYPIKAIRYCGSPYSVLVEDSDGCAYTYLLSTEISPRLHRYYLYNRINKDEEVPATPIGISPLSIDNILYYIPERTPNSITDLRYAQYRLPISANGKRVSSSLHGNVVCVTVEDKSGESVESYIFTNGDRRYITPNGIIEVLSSSNYVEFRSDYLRVQTSESTSTTYSGPCLINAQTGEHIMHLSCSEDIESHNLRYQKAYLLDNSLAAVFRMEDRGTCLRFYDIEKRVFLKEQILESDAQYFGWMKDGFFLYENRDTLFRDKPACEYTPDVLCSNYEYICATRNAYVFPFQTTDRKQFWYSAIDGQIRPLEHDWGLTPDGEYYVFANLRSNPICLEIIDARNLDTLFSRPIKGWLGGDTFDRSFGKFFYSEDRLHVRCMDIPSGKENWVLDIWTPVSIVAGNKYVVLQSTSLYVVDIFSGDIVCEFETNPATKQKLLLSPDEKWLLAGDTLYSLEEKELIASGLEDDYLSIENDYIVYPKRIMKLPNKNIMFN